MIIRLQGIGKRLAGFCRLCIPCLVLLGALSLTACVTTGSQSFEDTIPTQEEVAAKLAKASFPKELRDQIIRLHNPDAAERAAAATQLAKMGRSAAPAIPYLIRLLADSTPVQLSRYLGGGFYSRSETTPAEEASRALAKIGEPATNSLMLSLKDPQPGIRRLAAKALGQIGDVGAVEFLLALLEDPDQGVRATAALALGNYRNPVAVQKIMQAYSTASPRARADMVYALANINDILAVPFLMDHASDNDPDVRAAIMLALGKLRDGRVVPVLLTGITDTDEIVRANAAYALNTYYSRAVIDALINALADPVERVKEAAADSLVNLTGVNHGMDQARWQTWWRAQKDEMQIAPAKTQADKQKK